MTLMNELKRERWLAIAGYKNSYEVSDGGRVRSVGRSVLCGDHFRFYRGRTIRPGALSDGRLYVQLRTDGVKTILYIDELVLGAFVGPRPPGLNARNTNGDRSDNRAINLQWAVPKTAATSLYKHCPGCHRDLPKIAFSRRSNRPSGVVARCKSCARNKAQQWHHENGEKIQAAKRADYHANRRASIDRVIAWRSTNYDRVRDHHLMTTFGITLDQFNVMLHEQEGVCASCGRPESVIDSRSGRLRSLHVDHDHSTDEVRGLLCTACNIALGLLRDDPETIDALLTYRIRYAVAASRQAGEGA